MHSAPAAATSAHTCLQERLDNCLCCRGEYLNYRHSLERAIDEAYAAGFLGPDACGTGIQFDVYTQPGGGAYVCGELGACSTCCCDCWLRLPRLEVCTQMAHTCVVHGGGVGD